MSNITPSDLNLTQIQSSLYWQDPQANRDHFEKILDENTVSTDLVVLPEMFTTGFTMSPESLAEAANGPSVSWLREQAIRRNIAICGSVVIEEQGHYYNRFVWTNPDGGQVFYDKRHLFRMANEHEHYAAGTDRVVVSYRGWRILLQVCYDLRFPVFSRNRNDYDLAIYVANWPAVRRHPWRILLQARAIENLCYVSGVNRVGADGNGVKHSGDSMLVDFKGETVIDRPAYEPYCETQALSWQKLQDFRRKFPAWRDADKFQCE
ncbi:MAG: omega-amidase [Gammaproteobacteria bacterium]|jgi:omega-amidase